MKKLLATLCLSAATLATSAHAQKTGDAVTPEALQKLEWIQGEAPTAWEPGKLYILECWATWCGPCIAAIPHVDALYDKYQEKGLRVIGVDVWEDGKDKVVEFVKKKGEGMSYPVAYTGKGGPFEELWLKPAGVKGIPHAFLVKDGKVIATSHPARLTEELIESLLAGGDAGKNTLEKLNAAAAAQQAAASARAAFTEGKEKNDAAAMAAAADQLAAAEPDSIYVPLFRNEALIAAKDWSAIDKLIEGLDNTNKLRLMLVNSLGNTLSATEGVPAGTLAKAVTAYEATIKDRGMKTTVDATTLSRLQWAMGDKGKALAEANQGVELAKAADKASPRSIYPYEQFAAAVAAGTMPTNKEFSQFFRAAPVAPTTPVAPTVIGN
ncbi:TlpA family protein disulfide reductase [Luteolibacter yonseiensis]|uniref:TlpA family protein disulfide reductase n=1 Tax=Luteolibacter yonseiensis TaxID=1144680 RepID=A0A934R6Y4_9BACT|nr:TlpA disulfide reductase family protein [Luteolibacter yonseiensis]MBK1816355.1 TlpA family protein disulfide reductase [Luteolibacter yonseiensis]